MPTDQPDQVLALAETFGHVARLLAANGSLHATLQQIVNLAVDTLDTCEHAGISLVAKGRFTSPASSGEVPKTVDRIQAEVGEGPCLDAIREREVFRTGDLQLERRWPKFSTRANEATGIRSVLSLRLFIDEDTLGALNLYATRPDAFDDHDIALGSVFAAHAAVALLSARKEEELQHKAETRDLIGRAKGILMAESGVDADSAFDMLRRASQRLNVRIVDLAADLERAHSQKPPAT